MQQKQCFSPTQSPSERKYASSFEKVTVWPFDPEEVWNSDQGNSKKFKFANAHEALSNFTSTFFLIFLSDQCFATISTIKFSL